MVFAEKFLEWRANPLTHIGRNPLLGLNSFVNKFNKDAELLDDLNDHVSLNSKEFQDSVNNTFIVVCC